MEPSLDQGLKGVRAAVIDYRMSCERELHPTYPPSFSAPLNLSGNTPNTIHTSSVIRKLALVTPVAYHVDWKISSSEEDMHVGNEMQA